MRANASRSVLPTIVERLSETAVSTPVTENDWFIIGIFSKWRKIEVVKWAEDAIYAPIQTTDDKNRSLR